MKGFSSHVVALVCATAALLASPLVSGAGMSTHSMVGRRAEFWFSSSAYPEYKDLLLTHRNWWQPGTFFPDWGYSCGYSQEAEAAHWPPFVNFTANWVRDNYPRPWSADAENTIAFLFGMMAHGVADASWHSLSMNEGLIEIMQHTEFHGSFDDAHTKADIGGEFVLKFTTDLQGNAELRWNIPSDDLYTAYQLYFPSTQVTPKIMERCLLLGFAGIWANQIAGDLALPYVRNTPLLNEEYESYFLGGLNDMAAWTSLCYEDLAKWLEVGGHNRPMCTLMDNQWGREKRALEHPLEEPTEVLSGEKALEYLENFGFKVATHKVGRHLSFELQRRDGSDPQPLLDQLAEEIDKAMLQALKREEETAGVLEEVEATCVKENQFRNSSTISYNLGNAYSGLGSSLVTGDFNGDGIDDLAMGAPSFGGPGEPMVGVVYVLYGKRGMKPSVSLLQGIDQVASVTLRGDQPYSRFGDSLAVVDLNGDGIDDLAIAAPTYNGLEMYYDGRVYVHFGSNSGLQASASLTITTEQPFPIPVTGGTHTFKYLLLGSALSSGDADGDGFADLLIGSPQAAPHAQGHQRGLVSVFLSSSRHVGTLDVYQAADIEISGGEDYQRFGAHVEVAALPSGQKLILVGSNYFTNSDTQALGRLYGYDVKDTSSPLFTITGSDELQKFGAPFLVADFFGDNRTMVAVSAISEQVGRQWQAGALRIFDLEGLEGDLEFRRVDFETTIQGNEKNGHFSWGLASGSSSLWVSEPYFGNFRAEEKASTGRIYEYKFGGSFPTGVVRDRAAEADNCVTGKEIRGQFGRVVVALDIDADGQEDLAVSSFHSSSGSVHSGLVSVFFG